MSDVEFHVVDLLAPTEALHQYGAIMMRGRGGLYVVNEDRFRRTPYNGATDSGALYRHCDRDPELRSVTGLEADPPSQPHRVTVTFRDLRAVAALVATSRNPGRPGGGEVGLRLSWGDQVHVLDPGLAQQYADLSNEEVTAETILTQWAERDGWPAPSELIVRQLGAVAELRNHRPWQGRRRPTPEKLLRTPPIEVELEDVMAQLEAKYSELAPTRERVIADWMGYPGTAQQQVQEWNRRGATYLRAEQARTRPPEFTLPTGLEPALPDLPPPTIDQPPPPTASTAPPPIPALLPGAPAPALTDPPQPAPSTVNPAPITDGGTAHRLLAALRRRVKRGNER